ncbi:MAG: ComF family protein [Salinibacterium sp.]|nr:MAG: ComF family protein [Salinibacterium sp.]
MLLDALRDFAALVMPVACAGCGAEDRALCTKCRQALVPQLTHHSVDSLPVVSALRYEGSVRRVVLAFKDHGRTDVAAALASPLAAALDRAIHEHPAAQLVAIPTSRAAYRRRGYDPVRRLLIRGGFAAPRVLTRTRSTGSQKSLALADRAENLVGALAARRDLAGRTFIVVDDILTSGATIREAIRAISAARGEVVCAAVLAFTPRLLPMRDIGGGEDYGKAKGAQR